MLSLFKDGIGPSLLLEGLPNSDADETFEAQLRRQPPSELVASVSPLARVRAGEYNCATFVIHGTADEIAPLSGAKKFVQQLEARQVSHGFLVLPDAKHIHDVGIEVGSRTWNEQIAPGYNFLFETVRESSK